MSKQNPAFKKGYIEGASASIKATLADIELILEGEDQLDADEMRTELREKRLTSLTDLSTQWFKKGVNRGHKECFRHFEEHEEFPMTLKKSLSVNYYPTNML